LSPLGKAPQLTIVQVEFYFSDANLPCDRFLFEQTGGCENRPVQVKTIHNFKRMKRFQPYSAVVSALKDSETLEVIEARSGETGAEEVRRKVPLDKSHGTQFDEDKLSIIEDKNMPKTIYAKGFGDETHSTQKDLEDFFAPYGSTAVRLRRTHPARSFKGSVFVQFGTVEEQQEFLNLEPKPKYEGKELEIKSKKQYCEEKAELIKQGKIQPNGNGPQPKKFYGGNPGGRGGFRGRGRGRGGFDRYRGGDRNRDRSRDRSRSRDDRRRRHDSDDSGDDWKKGRDDFQKNGFRDRDDDRNGRKKYKGDRYGKHDRRDRRDRRDRSASEEAKPKAVQEYDEKGIPVVKSTNHDTEFNEHLNAGKKRTREVENEKGVSPKKVKSEAIDTKNKGQATAGAAST
jgi:lupus La protein